MSLCRREPYAERIECIPYPKVSYRPATQAQSPIGFQLTKCLGVSKLVDWITRWRDFASKSVLVVHFFSWRDSNLTRNIRMPSLFPLLPRARTPHSLPARSQLRRKEILANPLAGRDRSFFVVRLNQFTLRSWPATSRYRPHARSQVRYRADL